MMTPRLIAAPSAHLSVLHRLDPRVKIVTTFGLILGIILTADGAWLTFACLWALIVLLARAGDLSVWRLARLAGVALPFALAAATLPFTVPGRPLVTVLGMTVSEAGLLRFASILLRSWLAAQTALLLTLTTPLPDLLWAFRCLRVPASLIEIVAFMLRYLGTLHDEAQAMMRARAARSGRLLGSASGGGLRWRAKVAGGMVGSLFVRSYERSERVYAAMLARGYSGNREIAPPPLPIADVLMGVLPLLLVMMIHIVSLDG